MSPARNRSAGALLRAARRRLGRALLPADTTAPAAAANPLAEYFRNNPGRPIDKWMHYFAAYHRHFARFRGKPCIVLEFGVAEGGSLQMWRHYFGEQALIYGVDINPECKKFEEPGIRIFIGDQEDRDFLARIAAEIGPIDVLIEDGGHTMGQQIATFEVLYPKLSPRGVFLIEDLHTSYWPEFGGGYRNPGTFIEYAKNSIDQLQAWHSREPELEVDEFTRTTRSMHVYGSIVVFERGPVSRPRRRRTGQPAAPPDGAGGA
ncbi:MAG TPA: class I SAM-dependent methyltransferase [Sporichthya sp.]|nr:class I SAM-dependent methyltransferase [Sporichthya sp.]